MCGNRIAGRTKQGWGDRQIENQRAFRRQAAIDQFGQRDATLTADNIKRDDPDQRDESCPLGLAIIFIGYRIGAKRAQRGGKLFDGHCCSGGGDQPEFGGDLTGQIAPEQGWKNLSQRQIASTTDNHIIAIGYFCGFWNKFRHCLRHFQVSISTDISFPAHPGGCKAVSHCRLRALYAS